MICPHTRRGGPLLGNNERADAAVWWAQFDIDGMPGAMIHDGGPASRRPRRMAAAFRTARLVVCAHVRIRLA